MATRNDENAELDSDSDVEEQHDEEQMRIILSKLTPEQLDRYTAFRRSRFPRSAVQSLVSHQTGEKPSEFVAIALGGLTKMYVGELIETSRRIMAERDDRGPIRPAHIRKAFQEVRKTNNILNKRKKLRLPN